ncbi:MAG: hypothetical protein KC776_39565 [Myxococcales bacterium]|nr:hypothetical protein [Myxococcales bacterium]
MRLVAARLIGVGPFEDVELPFADEAGAPRSVTVIHGGGGVGKTTMLTALASTRPGYAVLPQVPSGDEPPAVICEWMLGADDPSRPHSLTVATPTPTFRVEATDAVEAVRRKEQALFDRRARQGGFAFLAIGATRWFSRQPMSMNAPLRSIARYDVRTPAAPDDAARTDLARETKQAICYADIAAALSEAGGDRGRHLHRLGAAMRAALSEVSGLAGFRYRGLDAASFEPTFVDADGRSLSFDELPTRVRHLVSFAALPVRTLWGAYPGVDPRQAEGVVCIDEVDLHQEPAVISRLLATLCQALPGVQWIATSSSAELAASRDAREVIALRRESGERVELCTGRAALTH